MKISVPRWTDTKVFMSFSSKRDATVTTVVLRNTVFSVIITGLIALPAPRSGVDGSAAEARAGGRRTRARGGAAWGVDPPAG